MPKNGPLIIVNENVRDQTLICKALDEIKLRNRIEICSSAEQALEFLQNTTDKPFLILTKTDLPGLSGLEFQKKIMEDDHLRSKSVPFIFLSYSEAPDLVGKAYGMRAQGYFTIPKEYINLKLALFCITDYWQRAVHPSSVDLQTVDNLK